MFSVGSVRSSLDVAATSTPLFSGLLNSAGDKSSQETGEVIGIKTNPVQTKQRIYLTDQLIKPS
jgi:hypothetical protein